MKQSTVQDEEIFQDLVQVYYHNLIIIRSDSAKM